MSGQFPDELKSSVVYPTQKNHKLDPEILANYRPVSTIPFISKLLEKSVIIQIQKYLVTNKLLDNLQSGFRPQHSVETALLKVTNDIYKAGENKQYTILCMLDLSAAFDTIDFSTLFDILENYYGIKQLALNWFKT